MRGRGAHERLERAPALRVLASSLRSGETPREALRNWHLRVADDDVAPLDDLARALDLGLPLPEALGTLREDEGGFAGSSLALSLYASIGGDLAGMIEALADDAAAWEEDVRSAQGSAAGARLSARMLAWLPLVFVPLLPVSFERLVTLPGLLALAPAAALLVAGFRWLRRLLPGVPGVGAEVMVARVLACAMQGGAHVRAVLDDVSRRAPPSVRGDMELARKRVELGCTWSEALRRCEHPGLKDLGAALARAEDLGTPVSGSLAALVRKWRSESAATFDRSLRMAPVKMTVPLAVCFLPAYGILTLGPLVSRTF